MKSAGLAQNKSPEPRFPENLPTGWRKALAPEKDKDYFQKLVEFLQGEARSRQEIYPPSSLRLRALQELDLEDVRVVILGQDPYHQPGQAMGLSFAVPNDLRVKPPSLVNMMKELQAGEENWQWDGKSSELTGWVEQGVLLLNTVLSVRRAQAFSHRKKGWEEFTDRIIETLGKREKPVVFLLWGSAAQSKTELIGPQHFVLKAAHPSPLSAHRGFMGCRHFPKANELLSKLGEPPIDWTRIN